MDGRTIARTETETAEVRIRDGEPGAPEAATGVVVFAHGSARCSPRNRFVARTICEAGVGTLLVVGGRARTGRAPRGQLVPALSSMTPRFISNTGRTTFMSKAHQTPDKAHDRSQKSVPAPQGSSLARRRHDELATRAYASPFSFMRRFTEEMDRLFDGYGFGEVPGLGSATWSPQIEMFEREGKLVVRADLPGLKREDIKVDLADDAIRIHGERRQEHEENREGYYRSERSYGSFHRTIPLPEGVDGEDATATFRDGVLEIAMDASKTKPRSRRLDIGEEAKT